MEPRVTQEKAPENIPMLMHEIAAMAGRLNASLTEFAEHLAGSVPSSGETKTEPLSLMDQLRYIRSTLEEASRQRDRIASILIASALVR